MAISKKPISNVQEDQIERLINKGGGSVNRSQYIHHENQIKITLRIPKQMLDVIDNYLDNDISKKTRTQWIKEAIEKRIKEDIT